MKISEAYNHWSSSYDTDKNLTRDLDRIITRDSLGDLQFKSILEVGCGTGKNTALLTEIGEEVHALDISIGMMRKAREKLRSSKITFSIADITKPWPYVRECADLVVCNLVLEHIEDLHSVFLEAFRSLLKGGRFFICELHPFRQYQGTKARFESNQGTTEIQAFVHHLSDYLEAAAASGLTLQGCREWWHEEDKNKPPRLVSFIFVK
jgi:ubiquinone/menaquinone biosynthesis C-methylase UbiE